MPMQAGDSNSEELGLAIDYLQKSVFECSFTTK
jgi:hypothetical protein